MQITFDLNNENESRQVLAMIHRQHPQFNTRVVTKAEIMKRTKGGTHKLLDALLARPHESLTCEGLGQLLGKTTTQVRGLVMILGRVEKSLGMKLLDRQPDGKVQCYSIVHTAREILVEADHV